MRLAVTGTPGTGKTTATTLLAEEREGIEVLHVNDLIEREGLYTGVDTERDSVVADLDAIEDRVAELASKAGDDGDGESGDAIVESHLAHHLSPDRVAVLRCHPETLRSRLLERGESEAKAEENAESEALDVILAEAVDAHGPERVYEIDTTDRSPGAVATALAAVLDGERDPSAGTVNFVGYLA